MKVIIIFFLMLEVLKFSLNEIITINNLQNSGVKSILTL